MWNRSHLRSLFFKKEGKCNVTHLHWQHICTPFSDKLYLFALFCVSDKIFTSWSLWSNQAHMTLVSAYKSNQQSSLQPFRFNSHSKFYWNIITSHGNNLTIEPYNTNTSYAQFYNNSHVNKKISPLQFWSLIHEDTMKWNKKNPLIPAQVLKLGKCKLRHTIIYSTKTKLTCLSKLWKNFVQLMIQKLVEHHPSSINLK